MWRYRVLVVLALTFATVSAGSLGAGVVAIQPVLEVVLDGGNLRLMATDAALARFEVTEASQLPSWVASVLEVLPERAYPSLIALIVGLGLLSAFGAIANFLHQFIALTVVHRTITLLRQEAFRHAMRLPLADVVVSGATDTVSRVIADTSALAQGFTAMLSKALAQLTKGVAGLVAAFILDWKMTSVALFVVPPLYITIRKLGKRVRRASRSALQERAAMLGTASESLQALRVVKSYTAERYEAARFHRVNQEVLKQLLRVRTARSIASPLVEGMTLILVGVLVVISGKAILDGVLDASTFLAVLTALGMAGASLKPLTGLINDIQASGAAADRLEEHFARRPEPGAQDSTLPRAKLPRHAESIRFESVSFAYPGAAENASRDVTLEITAGETVAFVGPNGSGKTTLLAMVPRLLEPDSGCVKLDGLDIAEASLASLRRQIAVVTQETVLFAGTIRSNITYGSSGKTDEELIDAAKRARAWDFIERLPDGLDTPVGEQGLTLSGGQRQRISIARAILRDPAVLILDEATSMIDAESEARINEALEEFGKGRTCLIVAHRLSTVLSADRIVVLDRGKLVDQGSHDELLERCGVYQQIARTQLHGGQA